MEIFINNQISSYNKKKYDINNFYKIKNIQNDLFLIKIKDNKIIYSNITNMLNRDKAIIKILELLLVKYKITDTVILINLHDGCNWKYDIPVFNFGVPDGKKGLTLQHGLLTIFLSFNIAAANLH